MNTVTPNFVVSSTIDAIAWMSQTLYVRFRSGATYAYDGVPYDLYDGLKKAESCGRFLHLFVKKAGFRYTKLDHDPFVEDQLAA